MAVHSVHGSASPGDALRILGDPEVIAAVREFVALDARRQLSSSSSET